MQQLKKKKNFGWLIERQGTCRFWVCRIPLTVSGRTECLR